MNKQFNIYHTTESERFVTLQKALTKVLKPKMGQSVTSKVRSGMQELNAIQGLLKLAVIINDTAKGEKNKKDKDANPAVTQGEHQSADKIPSSGPIVESQGEQLADLEDANK
ncbi:hypothetical protein Tco_1019057 [Tanacetum coccineum]|uniref:Uncharacterized protein n=1 Tax=Tanacetum coccineum TaxID=301880 RepID=A0ABQ5FW40_9ASTR